MNKTENKKINIIEKIKNNKKAQYAAVIIISLLITILFLLNSVVKNDSVATSSEVDAYVSRLENKLSEVLSEVKGVGKVSVVIKVDGGMETVIATKTITTENGGKTEREETPVLVNGKTVPLKELYPKISGVIIVAEGADNISVMKKIQQATLSLLDIDLNKIEILEIKKGEYKYGKKEKNYRVIIYGRTSCDYRRF